MSRSIDNVTKTKKVTPGGGNNPRHNRKSYHKLSDSSSISSNRNSHSEDDIRVVKNDSCDEQEQITKKLQAQVKELRHKLRILEDSIDSKDYSLGTISREKDRAIGEIRRLERSNKLLRQQLNDERNHYWEEKEKFCEEMTKYKRKLQDVKSDTDKRRTTSGRQPLINQSFVRQLSKQRGDFVDEKSGREVKKSKSHNLELKNRKSNPTSYFSFTDLQRKHSSLESFPFYGGDDVLLQIAALRTENARLRSIIGERDEQNYELCLRFLRMKHSKNDIRDRFQDLENEYLQVIANLMDKIDEARQEFNFIIDQKFKRPLHSTNAMYLQMVQKNSRIAFENAALRLENQCLKKELNKYINSSCEYDSAIKRRTIPEPADDELEVKVSPESSKNSEKLKTIKKNVNFKEVRTIFERCHTYRNSDTDSNYMSKTPTTGASNGSLKDPKSAESISEDVGEENKVALPSQATPFPDEILRKIFQRIDSSCQSLDASKPQELTQNDPKTKESEITEQTPDTTQKEVAVINVPKLIDSPSFSDKKKTENQKTEKPKKDNYFWLGRCPWKEEEPLIKTQLRNHVRCEWKFDKSPEGLSLDFPLRKFTLTKRSRSVKPSKALKEEPKPEASKPTTIVQTLDSCGLQEKLEFSDLELPGDCNQSLEPGNSAGEKPEHPIVRVELVELDEEDLGGNERMKTLAPAIGSRSRSSNKVNLQAELMEANTRQTPPHESWRNENKVHITQSNSSKKTSDSEKESVNINLQCDLPSTQEMVLRGMEPPPQQKKLETCKRFSHRLFTTSPEELKHILTDPQLGTIKMSPAIVGHATTEIIPPFKSDTDDILMQLIMPPSNSENSVVYSQTDLTEWMTPEKEASFSVISPVEPTVSNQIEVCASDIQIPLSSLPTSNSTMEMFETGELEGRKLIRTLSAPGLLESSWLDPHTICEMRDCSTNT